MIKFANDQVKTMAHQSPAPNPESHIKDVFTAFREGVAQLAHHRVPAAAFTAEMLMLHTLGRDRAWFYAHPESDLDAATREKYFSLIALRASGVPTQHLTGRQEFWGLEIEATPDVLIPRPETEHLIEVALERLRVSSDTGPLLGKDKLHIADVGTGSGCIAIALAHEFPAAHVTATDISVPALVVARRNATRHNCETRIDFIECDLLSGVDHDSTTFDLIVSNPPYVGHWEAATLSREVREHEPALALFGGETGTEIYAPLIQQAAVRLKPGGTLVLELGHTSAEYVSNLLCSPLWTGLAITNDLAGIPRVASAQRRSD
ncbi:MAG TPA: peptide chain release factor N(5)-glutamine methyltransferase [Candidatus Acidoferrales bacterium]